MNDGSTTVDPNGPWLSWSIDNDIDGRVVREWTPAGAAFTGSAGDALGDAIGYDRAYTYDNADRLTQVRDRTAATTGVDVTDPTQVLGCITRTYGFDRNDNRLTKANAAPAADGSCSTTGVTTTTRTFDTADRPVTGANAAGNYIYDALGRTTTLPASDAPQTADGNITLSYYDNDLARSISQAGTTTTFTLDALDRRSTESVTGAGGTEQTVRHYADASDNPVWVTQGSNTQRYAELIGSDLALTVDQVGTAELTLNNSHGDVVTTVDLPTGGAVATGIGGWNNYDEYGNAVGFTADTGIVNYGWLGGKQRAASGAGLTLMGVRLYNPATGLFTSVDPVEGGNANAYTYPGDPINSFDIDGKRRYDEGDESPRRARFKKWWNGNGFGDSLGLRKSRYPCYPYKCGGYSAKPTKSKTTKWWPRKKHWKKFGSWSMRRLKGGVRGGIAGYSVGGTAAYSLGCTVGRFTRRGCKLTGAAYAAYTAPHNTIGGAVIGAWKGSNKWFGW